MLKVAVLAIVVTIFGLILFDVGLITSKFIKPSIPFFNSQALVSGTIQVNGPIPQGSSISVGVREHGSSRGYDIFASGLPAADETNWQYTQAKEGSSYQFQAYLNAPNTTTATSDILVVTAPASEEVLTLNIETVNPAPQTAVISGNIYINGYIPTGATFDILGRPYGSTGDFSEVVDNLPADVKQFVNFADAAAGQKYELKGQIFDKNGTVVGSSSPVVISAPSDNLIMTINSSAQPPAGSITPIATRPQGSTSPSTSALPISLGTTISGTINFNGSAPGGSSIVILAAPAGVTSYQTVANGISPANGSIWNWNGAAAGTTYNMVAVLKGQSNGQNIDYADSQTYTVAAPASYQLFTLNTGISMGAPTGSVSITCGTKGSNNIWNSNTVNFSTVTGAQYYSFQVGSTSGGNDIANIQQAAQSTPNQTINVSNINDSVIYYAQYAVSSVTNPTPAQYSPYTGAYTLKCPN